MKRWRLPASIAPRQHARMELIDVFLCVLAGGCGILGYWLYYGFVTTFVY